MQHLWKAEHGVDSKGGSGVLFDRERGGGRGRDHPEEILSGEARPGGLGSVRQRGGDPPRLWRGIPLEEQQAGHDLAMGCQGQGANLHLRRTENRNSEALLLLLQQVPRRHQHLPPHKVLCVQHQVRPAHQERHVQLHDQRLELEGQPHPRHLPGGWQAERERILGQGRQGAQDQRLQAGRPPPGGNHRRPLHQPRGRRLHLWRHQR